MAPGEPEERHVKAGLGHFWILVSVGDFVFPPAEPCRGFSDWPSQKARRRVPFQKMPQKQCDNYDPRAMRKCGWGRGKCGINLLLAGNRESAGSRDESNRGSEVLGQTVICAVGDILLFRHGHIGLRPSCPSLWSHRSAAGNKFDHLMSGAADPKAAAFTCKRKTKVSCWNCPSLSVRTIRDLTIWIVCLKRYDPKRFRNNSGNSC